MACRDLVMPEVNSLILMHTRVNFLPWLPPTFVFHQKCIHLPPCMIIGDWPQLYSWFSFYLLVYTVIINAHVIWSIIFVFFSPINYHGSYFPMLPLYPSRFHKSITISTTAQLYSLCWQWSLNAQ